MNARLGEKTLVCVLLLLVAMVTTSVSKGNEPSSVCILKGQPGVIGHIILHTGNETLSIEGVINGTVASVVYSISIHVNGDISKTDDTTVGATLHTIHDLAADESTGQIVLDQASVSWSSGNILGRSLVLRNTASQSVAQCVVGVQNSQNNSSATSNENISYDFAVCEVLGESSKSIFGRVSFERVQNNVTVRARVCGLSDGYHGFHIHEFGDLRGAIDMVGSHFNPSKAKHSLTNDPSRHAGDLGNIQSSNGLASYEQTLDLVALSGSNSIIGRGLVIHSGKDQGSEFQPAGESGTKLTRCVIGSRDTLPALNDITCPSQVTTQKAICIIRSTSKSTTQISGTVYFENNGTQSFVYGTVSGLVPNSTHGFHVHQYGDVGKADGSGAGGHFNPTSAPHSNDLSVVNRHIGDMGNIVADGFGVAAINIQNLLWKLQGAHSIIGRSLIVHEQRDNGSQPVGFAGLRFGQCVIGVYNTNNNVAKADSPGTDYKYAVAEIKGINNDVRGRVVFDASGSTVTVSAKICGLTPGQHGFHIHQFGDLQSGDSVGSHYDPNQQPHRLPPNMDRHVGDLGNINATSKGLAAFTINAPTLLLSGATSILGRAIVVHSDSDKGQIQQPAGASGLKIAMGAIGVTDKLIALPNDDCEDVTPTPTPSEDRPDNKYPLIKRIVPSVFAGIVLIGVVIAVIVGFIVWRKTVKPVSQDTFVTERFLGQEQEMIDDA